MFRTIRALACAAVISFIPGSLPASPLPQMGAITVFVDGQPMSFANVQPQQRGGIAMVPLRDVLSRIGGSMKWSSKDKAIMVIRGTRLAKLKVGSRMARVNGRPFELDAAPTTIAGQTMVPARFFGQAFSTAVVWNMSNNVVAIVTPEAMNSRPVTAAYRRQAVTQTQVSDRTATPAPIVDRRPVVDSAYTKYLENRDFQQYLADRAAWVRSYQDYRQNHTLLRSQRMADPQTQYRRYLSAMDADRYNTDTFAWQQNYNSFARSRRLVSVTPPPSRWDEYLRDREQLVRETDNAGGVNSAADGGR